MENLTDSQFHEVMGLVLFGIVSIWADRLCMAILHILIHLGLIHRTRDVVVTRVHSHHVQPVHHSREALAWEANFIRQHPNSDLSFEELEELGHA